MIFFYLSEGMENCKMSGKNQGILKLMISGHPVDASQCLQTLVMSLLLPGYKALPN